MGRHSKRTIRMHFIVWGRGRSIRSFIIKFDCALTETKVVDRYPEVFIFELVIMKLSTY